MLQVEPVYVTPGSEIFVNVMVLPAQIGAGDKVNEAFGFLEIRIGVTVEIVGPVEFVAVIVAPYAF